MKKIIRPKIAIKQRAGGFTKEWLASVKLDGLVLQASGLYQEIYIVSVVGDEVDETLVNSYAENDDVSLNVMMEYDSGCSLNPHLSVNMSAILKNSPGSSVSGTARFNCWYDGDEFACLPTSPTWAHAGPSGYLIGEADAGPLSGAMGFYCSLTAERVYGVGKASCGISVYFDFCGS